MSLFGKKKEIIELQKRMKASEFQNAALKDTLYKVGNELVFGSDLINAARSGNFGNQGIKIYVPTDPYEIYLTCGDINTAIFKISNWISKYSWKNTSPGLNALLDKPNPSENFTTIIRKYVVDMLVWGNCYWYLLNPDGTVGIRVIPFTKIKVEWDDENDDRKYLFIKENGDEEPIDREYIIHFILQPNSIELVGYSKISTIQNEIEQYYLKTVKSKKRDNVNEKPAFLASLAPGTPPEHARQYKFDFMKNTNPNEPYFANGIDKIFEFNKDDNFGVDFIAFQNFFRDLVYRTFGMSQQDIGLISTTKASSQTLVSQTESTMIDPLRDIMAEGMNNNPVLEVLGEYEWDKPDLEGNTNSQQPKQKENQQNTESMKNNGVNKNGT